MVSPIRRFTVASWRSRQFFDTFMKIRAALAPLECGRKVHMLTSTLSMEAPFVDVEDGITLAHAIVDTVRDPLMVLDHDLRVIAASRSFYKTFRLVREDVRGHLLYKIDGGQWDIPELRELLGTISSGQATVEGYEVDREFPAIGQRVMLLNARKVFYEKVTHTSILLAFEDITDRRAIERQVQELLREKDMLLEEMQHRVANSLQIIASILLIKARTVQSEETRLQLEDAHQRVLSVAAVQQHLHLSGRNEPIELANYLTKLCETLAKSMIGDSRPISLKVDSDAGTAISRDAVSLGLIVTELVMNALKHAFPGEKPDAAIIVSYKVAGTDWKLTVSDNGIGKPDVSASDTKPGLGTSLVKALTRQLEAVLDIASNSRGTAVSITHATFKSKPSNADEKLPA
jgi:two-component sensor histidine kinase/PAS domain-containing protein